MTVRYLRNKKDGFIYEWHPILAANPLCEEVTEEQAFPERFMGKAPVKKARARRKKDQPELDFSTDDIDEQTSYTPEEIKAEASKGLPE